jgi:hypothetical protein
MEPASYRIARPKSQEITANKLPVANSPPSPRTSALLAEPNTGKQSRYAKFESIDGNETGEQLDFNDIVLGIKEGSLEVRLYCCFSAVWSKRVPRYTLTFPHFISGHA